MRPPSPRPSAPFRVEAFSPLAVLGVGSFGVVRLARHASSGAAVALKAFAKDAVAAARLSASVARERRLLASLRHPFVVALFGAFQDRDRVFLALEFLPGGELRGLLLDGDADGPGDGHKALGLRPSSPVRSCGPVPEPNQEGTKGTEGTDGAEDAKAVPPQLDAAGARAALRDPRRAGGLHEWAAAFYIACVASALKYLHASGVVYRDLKPENVVLDRDGYAKLVDFGLAVPFGPSSDTGRRATLCGSVEYMAPEVLQRAARHDPRVDLWSLGVLLFELLVGHTPFHHDNPREVARRVIHESVVFPEGFAAAHPLATELIGSLLVKDPSRRIQSVPELQRHAWFRSFLHSGRDGDKNGHRNGLRNWDRDGDAIGDADVWTRLERRELVPPFVPRLTDAFDASFFVPDGLDELDDDAPPYMDANDDYRDFNGF